MSILARVGTLSAAILLIPLLVATTFVACASSSHDLEIRLNQLEASQAETAAQLQRVTIELDSLTKGQLIAVLDLIERADIHHMDEELQEATQIDPLYLGTVRKLKRVVLATSWPTPLENKAQALEVALTEFEVALTNDDLTASREAVRKVHLAYHPLTEAGWKLIAGEPTD